MRVDAPIERDVICAYANDLMASNRHLQPHYCMQVSHPHKTAKCGQHLLSAKLEAERKLSLPGGCKHSKRANVVWPKAVYSHALETMNACVVIRTNVGVPRHLVCVCWGKQSSIHASERCLCTASLYRALCDVLSRVISQISQIDLSAEMFVVICTTSHQMPMAGVTAHI